MLKEQILQKSFTSKVIDEIELMELLKLTPTYLSDLSELPAPIIDYMFQVYNVNGVTFRCEPVGDVYEWIPYDTSGQILNYLDASNKPTINGVPIVNDLTLQELGLPVGNIKLTDVSVTEWGASVVYLSYGYESEIKVIGVTSDDVAFVVFGVDESDSGNYASVCETGEDFVKIFSKVATAITIKTIEIHKY